MIPIRKTGWAFPCDKEVLERERSLKLSIADTKNNLIDCWGNGCPCGKNCKPIKVEVIVRPIKEKNEYL